MTRFADFWSAWPANSGNYTRKGCKSECLRRWTQRGMDLEADHIIAHVQWLKTTEDWCKSGGQFIPAPLVYLNQARWDGAEIPESPKQSVERAQAVYQRQLEASRATVGAKPERSSYARQLADSIASMRMGK